MYRVTWIKLYYVVMDSFYSLIRRKGYLSSFVMIFLLLFLVSLSWKGIGFFFSWIDLERSLQEKAPDLEASSFQPLLLLLTILKTGTLVVSIFLILAVILYSKHFYKQKAGIEQEELLTKRLLGETSSIISLTFMLEAGYVLLLLGSVALVLGTQVFQRLLADIQALGAFQMTAAAYKPNFRLELLFFLLIVAITLVSVFYSVFRFVEKEERLLPTSSDSSDADSHWE